jgi:hypothetical protein
MREEVHVLRELLFLFLGWSLDLQSNYWLKCVRQSSRQPTTRATSSRLHYPGWRGITTNELRRIYPSPNGGLVVLPLSTRDGAYSAWRYSRMGAPWSTSRLLLRHMQHQADWVSSRRRESVYLFDWVPSGAPTALPVLPLLALHSHCSRFTPTARAARTGL